MKHSKAIENRNLDILSEFEKLTNSGKSNEDTFNELSLRVWAVGSQVQVLTAESLKKIVYRAKKGERHR